MADISALEQYPPGVHVDKAGNAIDEGRLSRSVWTDDSEDLPLMDIEAQVEQCLDAAEGLAYVHDLKDGFADHTLTHLSN